MDDIASIQPFKCEKCGLESTIKEAFIQKQGLWAGSKSTVCFTCAIKQQARKLAEALVLLPVLGVLLHLLSPGSWLSRLYFQVFAGLLMAFPLIVVHELAHALVAWLVGLRAFVIHLGAGPVLGSWLFLGMKWTLHAFPVSGATLLCGREMRFYRARTFLTLLAGPAVHAVLMILLLAVWLILPPGTNPWLSQAIAICGWTNAFLFLANMLPKKTVVAVGMAVTDGQAMINLIKAQAANLSKEHSFYYLFEAIAAVEREKFAAARSWIEQGLARDPDDPHIVNGLGYVHMSMYEPAPARVAFTRLLAMTKDLSLAEKLEPSMRYVALNNIAYADILLKDPALLDEALAYSEQAYKNMAWEPAIIMTRGAALIMAGKLDEGTALMKSAMRQQPRGRDRAVHTCFLALAEAKRGSRAEADKLLEKARKIDRKCKMLAWTRDMIEESKSG